MPTCTQCKISLAVVSSHSWTGHHCCCRTPEPTCWTPWECRGHPGCRPPPSCGRFTRVARGSAPFHPSCRASTGVEFRPQKCAPPFTPRGYSGEAYVRFFFDADQVQSPVFGKVVREIGPILTNLSAEICRPLHVVFFETRQEG